jgi:methyl-accepting chemotaxis protein
MTTRRTQTIGVLAAGFGLAFLLLWLITRAMTRPMTQAISIFHAIEAGMYDNRIESSGSDEASQVLQSLDQLQRKLRTEAAGGSLQATAELRIKSALDRASSRVVLADENFKIIYVNGAMQQFLFEARSDLRRDLPRLDIDHIVGASLDGLFKSHVNQRRTLQESPSYSTDLNIGDRSLRLATNAVIDPEGHRIGTMVELIDRFDRSHAAAIPSVVNG